MVPPYNCSLVVSISSCLSDQERKPEYQQNSSQSWNGGTSCKPHVPGYSGCSSDLLDITKPKKLLTILLLLFSQNQSRETLEAGGEAPSGPELCSYPPLRATWLSSWLQLVFQVGFYLKMFSKARKRNIVLWHRWTFQSRTDHIQNNGPTRL